MNPYFCPFVNSDKSQNCQKGACMFWTVQKNTMLPPEKDSRGVCVLAEAAKKAAGLL